jgi:flagellar P-ring protein precursor FlgI
VQVNQLNGGRITNGAIIERELPTQFGAGNTINLQLNNEDFTMAQQIADTINRSRGYGSATALDARTVQIRTSTGSSNQVRMLADIQNMEVNAGSGCQSDHQLPYRLGGDEPGSVAGQLRRGAG